MWATTAGCCLIGEQAWPLPIPLVRDHGAWRFATEEGIEEIINRRVGANERNAIKVLQAYLDAQKEYASRDRNGDGVLQYAQKLGSTPGKHDGLYWPADESKGEERAHSARWWPRARPTSRATGRAILIAATTSAF